MAEVLVPGSDDEPALTWTDVTMIAYAFGGIVGPATLAQLDRLKERLIEVWRHPNMTFRREEQAQSLEILSPALLVSR
jgi:hypothetical protein